MQQNRERIILITAKRLKIAAVGTVTLGSGLYVVIGNKIGTRCLASIMKHVKAFVKFQFVDHCQNPILILILSYCDIFFILAYFQFTFQ